VSTASKPGPSAAVKAAATGPPAGSAGLSETARSSGG
jgi:hypothetical protein